MAEDKREARRRSWLAPERMDDATPEARRLFLEREARLEAVIRLEKPDRVPLWHGDLGFFPASYTGITFEKMMYDSEAMAAAFRQTIVDFAPDMYWGPPVSVPGDALGLLDCRQLRWPGHSLPANVPFQYVEDEYMKADEYETFLDDPTDYVLRTYLPRLLGTLAPLRNLPSLKGFLGGYHAIGAGAAFADPEVMAAFESLFRAGKMIQKHQAAVAALHDDLSRLGFPAAFGATVVAPFDFISDTLRGMHGIMLDMYRRPERILAATEKLLPFQLETVLARAEASGHPRAMVVMHRGSDAFMSAGQWETFYWPGYKKIIMTLIDEGITPLLFLEGNVTSRLKYLAELPRGKALAMLDSTDMYQAKEILGDVMGICGLMPLSLLQTGTPAQVRDYARTLIDVVGKGGGFIMGARSVLDEAKPDLVRAWFDYTREYGVYK